MGLISSHNFTQDLNDSRRILREIQTGTIQERCLLRWDDSLQVHSTRTIIRWNYQAVKTTMKKLEHCIKIRVTVPINVQGVAKAYIDQCIQRALNDNKVLHILSGIIAPGVDVLSAGATGGSATAAAVADYVYAVQDRAISCLTDTGRIESYLSGVLKDKFNGKVSRWIYWEL
jgi:hypothetical protein